GEELRKRFLDGAGDDVEASIADVADSELAPLIQDLAGHDLASMLAAYASCDAVTDRPSVIFAYTVKGFGLPIAGNPRNHSALLSVEQVDALRAEHGLTPDNEWDRFDAASPAGIWVNNRREALQRPPRAATLPIRLPTATGVR